MSSQRISRLAIVVIITGMVTAHPESVTAQTPDVEYASLEGNQSKDCGVTTGSVPCRVRSTDPLEQIQERLTRNENAWRRGDTINFAFKLPIRSQGSAPILTGSIQAPLSQIRNTQIWVLSMFVPQLDRASLPYMVVNPIGSGRHFGITPEKTWKGPRAPADAVVSKQLHGAIATHSLPSASLPKPRQVFVYTPPALNGEPIAAVVYMTDGGNVQTYAAVLDTLIMDGKLPRILLVGAESGDFSAQARGIRDARSAEYVMGMDSTQDRFIAHEIFFTQTLLNWAETTHGAPRDRERRIVQGASAGAAFALQMGIRHGDLYAHVIAHSPAGIAPPPSPIKFTATPSFYIWAGLLEPQFHRNAQNWTNALKQNGATAMFTDEVNGHDLEAWKRDLPAAITWSIKENR